MNSNLPKGFRLHFEEAKVLNKHRMVVYSQMTNGESRFVSNILIFSERILYPVAWYFDWRAKGFNSRGIGIIVNDFMPLNDNIPPTSRNPIYSNVLRYSDIKHLFRKMFLLRCKIRRELRHFNFCAAHATLVNAVDEIAQYENENSTHIAMLKHIIESSAFACKNAKGYAELGDKKVLRLARCFINTQMLGTILSPLIDRSANRIHALGVGILVNDIPEIPFQ